MSVNIKLMDESLKALAEKITSYKENIVLLFAFNGTGKTRLSVEYKDLSKLVNDGEQNGVYYNSYSEDLFQWYKNDENPEEGIILKISYSNLNQFHSLLDESIIREKLEVYRPKFEFRFNYFQDVSYGIESISFFSKNGDTNPIKVSRGEEQIFIWCFFLAIFDIQGWKDKDKAFLFIDDPVSSLDDNNIFVTAAMLLELIADHYDKNKIIITTHHAGFFSLLSNWLTKGEKAGKYSKCTIQRIIKSTTDGLDLVTFKKDVFLYHLELIQTLQQAVIEDSLHNFHFAILRQVIENIASFLGTGQVSYVLDQIGINDTDRVMQIINALSHEKIFRFQASAMIPDNKEILLEVFNAIKTKYNFVIHVEDK